MKKENAEIKTVDSQKAIDHSALDDFALIEEKVHVKLFLGIAITSEIKMHLKLSKEWENITKLIDYEDSDLIQVHYHKKDYIGYFAKSDQIPIEDVRLANENVRKKLLKYCPLLQVEKFNVSLFPQIFIS